MSKQRYYLKDESVPVKEDYDIITWSWKWTLHNIMHERWTPAFIGLISENLNLN